MDFYISRISHFYMLPSFFYHNLREPTPSSPLSRIYWVSPEVSLWFDMSKTPHLGGILGGIPDNFNWLLLMRRSRGSTLSTSQMNELLSLSLSVSPGKEAHLHL